MTCPKKNVRDFAAAIRKYYPALDENALQTGYAGVRPKIQAPGEAARDFLISDREAHGIDGLVILYGIESPGLTACLAIADHVENVPFTTSGKGSVVMAEANWQKVRDLSRGKVSGQIDQKSAKQISLETQPCRLWFGSWQPLRACHVDSSGKRPAVGASRSAPQQS